MLKVVGREEGDWILPEELLNFPCADLRTIDQLWFKYSNRRFGFSIQKKIYLECGGKADDESYYKEAFEKFGYRVGWRVDSRWIGYFELTYDTSAPIGHLPFPAGIFFSQRESPMFELVVLNTGYTVLFSRIQTCKL